MRKIYTFVLLSLSLVYAASAQRVTAPHLVTGSTSVYAMSCENVTLKIDAAQGGRIISFTVHDSTGSSSFKKPPVEILSQNSDINQFGSTFWPSPQAEWTTTTNDWPPMPILDKSPYTVSIEGNIITLTSGLETQGSFNLRVVKKLQFNPVDTSLVINYKIINESSNEQSWAPWEVTRVDSKGLTVFKKGEGSITGPLFTSNTNRVTEAAGYYWYNYSQNVSNSSGEKLMCDGVGWLAHVPDSKTRVLIKRFDNLPVTGAGAPAPGESELQVYTGNNNGYTELENQGAYQTILPGASIDYTVRWYGRAWRFSTSGANVATGSPLVYNFINAVIARGDQVAASFTNQKAETTTISVNSSLNIMTVETNLTSYNNVEFVVYDLQGKVALKHALLDSQQQISVNNLTTGNYLYQINSGSTSISKGKLMINR